ncbi:hypothetical protein J6590_021377 [Homalodisca vitripennis]|nr:hypothetical protein J6590_021377 [Homalodisca vitripennis]
MSRVALRSDRYRAVLRMRAPSHPLVTLPCLSYSQQSTWGCVNYSRIVENFTPHANATGIDARALLGVVSMQPRAVLLRIYTPRAMKERL